MNKGIYKIENMVNGKLYIGSSCNLKSRFSKHRNELSKNTHHSLKLQNAWNKYGAEAFKFEIVEYVDVAEMLISREQVLMDKLSPEYNIAPVAGSALGVKRTADFIARVTASNKGQKRSAETCQKIREIRLSQPPMPQETKDKMSKSRIGKKLPPRSDEWKAKMSELKKGFKHTEETKKRIGDASRGKPRSAETKEKLRAAMLKRAPISEETRQRMSASSKGKKKIRTPEHTANVVASRLRNKALRIAQCI